MNLVQTYAGQYADLGWSVIPINAFDKKPALASWRRFQSERMSPDDIRKGKWDNVAVIAGRVSRLCIIDEDDLGSLTPKERKTAEDFLGALPSTATSKTGKGRHYWFSLPEGVIIPSKVRFLPGIDCRAEGGYALAPPSSHPSGAFYSWEDEHTPSDGLAELPDWAAEAIRKGKAVAETDEEGKWETLLAGVAEGVGRNNAAASLTGKLLSTMPQELWGEAWNVVKGWNERNKPPLSQNELRTTFESIKRKELERKNDSQTNATGTDLRDLLTSGITAATPIIHDLLVPGVTMLVGKPKLGKSRLALQLALSVASGNRPFSKLQSVVHGVDGATVQGEVLVLALEDSLARFKSRAAGMLGLSAPPPGFRVFTQFPHLFEGGLDRLGKEITNDTRLVVIDTLAAFVGGSADTLSRGSAFQAEYRMMRPLFDLVNGTNTCILMLTHARKDQAYQSDPFDTVAGTLGSLAAVDSVLVMYHPRKRPVTLVGRGRDIEGFTLPLADDGLRWKIAQEEEQEEPVAMPWTELQRLAGEDMDLAFGKANSYRAMAGKAAFTNLNAFKALLRYHSKEAE